MTNLERINRIVADLSRPDAYPYPVEQVEVRQTHISAVFLAGAYVYKVKKPVELGFLDFRTLDQRRHFCHEEVRLNRRLAPSVYLGVVAITAGPTGLSVEGEGEVIDYAVKMLRLPDEAQLRHQLEHEQLDARLLRRVARRLAEFHSTADCGPAIAADARYEPVRKTMLDNFAASVAQVGHTVSQPVFSRLRELTERALEQSRIQIEQRALAGMARDGHGDLHLDHIYHFPDRQPPHDLAIIDCIEFRSSFRHVDPVADVAFLAMDLGFRGRPELAREFTDAYFEYAQDAAGRSLLPLYLAYRSAVRAKVNGIGAGESEIPEAQRHALRERAGAHWLYALGELETPRLRPGLVLIGGLPGTGKSTLARAIAAELGFTVVSSDPVRKELAGLDPLARRDADFGTGMYTAEWNDRTYAACRARAEQIVAEGGRVLVDANFREEQRRRVLLDTAQRMGVRTAFLLCEADSGTIHSRLTARRNDASDAGVEVYQKALQAWQPVSPQTRRLLHHIASTESSVALAAAHAALVAVGLA